MNSNASANSGSVTVAAAGLSSISTAEADYGARTMLLAVRATAKVRALQGLGKRYTVIGSVRARLRPPPESEGDPQREP